MSRATGVALGRLVNKGEVTPAELVEAAVTRDRAPQPAPQRGDPQALRHGRGRRRRRSTASAPFAGVPYLLKELGTAWQGAPLTNSSFYLKDLIAPFDAEVVTRLKKAGFLLVGKSNAPENGWCISTEPKLYGATLNPWREGMTAGGSSGGSCAAVAARMVPIAEASDAAGSIRVPASCCGVDRAETLARARHHEPLRRHLARRRLLPLQLAHGARHGRLSRRRRRLPAGRSLHAADARRELARAFRQARRKSCASASP